MGRFVEGQQVESRLRLRLKWIAGLIVLLTVGAVSSAVYRHGSLQARRQLAVDALGGEEGLEILRRPSKVEGYHLARRTSMQTEKPKNVAFYPAQEGPIPVPEAIATELADLVSSPDSFGDVVTSGPEVYDFRYSYQRDGHTVDVLTCYGSNTVVFARDGTITRGYPLSPKLAEAFNKAAIELFPRAVAGGR